MFEGELAELAALDARPRTMSVASVITHTAPNNLILMSNSLRSGADRDFSAGRSVSQALARNSSLGRITRSLPRRPVLASQRLLVGDELRWREKAVDVRGSSSVPRGSFVSDSAAVRTVQPGPVMHAECLVNV